MLRLEIVVRVLGILTGIFFVFKFPEDIVFWIFFITTCFVPSSYEVYLRRKKAHKIVLTDNGKGERRGNI